LITPTLAQQLESVQAAITAIESGAQAASSEGESVTRPSLEALYKREEQLLNKIARGDRGNISVMET
jgi:FixJ family two-component response regulator